MVQKWQLKVNFSLLYLGKPHEFGEYTINGNVIKACDLVKDLGVQIDSKLKFHNHTTVVIKKANHLVAIVWKTFQLFDKVTLIDPYKTFLRPVLEHGNIIWGLQHIQDQQEIEKVQRRETKLIRELQNHKYDDRLANFNLPSLKYCRQHGDMIMTYNYWNIDASDLFTLTTRQ